MSWVANVMILVDPQDEEFVRKLSTWLETDAPRLPWAGPGTGVGSLRTLTESDK